MKMADFLALLKGVKPAGEDQWLALCPGHNDREQSLNVKEAAGKILVKCFAGCKLTDILKPLGLKPKDLFLDSHEAKLEHREIEAIYHYTDANGKPFQMVRIRPKGFYQRQPDGMGGYVNNLKGIVPTLYHQDELKQAIDSTEPIYLVEGEKDADRLWRLGLVATTNPMGAGKWRNSYTKALQGADLIIIPDNDGPGREHISQVARSCYGIAKRIRVLELPSESKDVSDWLDAGWARQELEELVAVAPEWKPQEKDTAAPAANILTDTTNAEFMAHLYGNRLRYDHLRGRWLIWGGHYWQEDADGQIYRLETEAARERYRQSVNIEDLKERQRVASWAISSEQRGRLEAAVALAKNIKPIADGGKDWDTDPWLLGVDNGMLDLKTGELQPGRPADRITMSTGVHFNPGAKCPRWLQFLTEVFGEEELIDWLHRALGYSLTGDTTEQCVFIGHGIGANGKSRFIEAVRYALGDYAYSSPFSTFELFQRASIPNDLAALEFRRFVISSETSDNTRLNEARVKAISGGDPITARYLHREFFTYMPHLKLWLFVNHRPGVADDSFGFWRRVRLIPFTRQFTGGADDQRLGEKLKAEATGILAWLVRGCLKWQKQRLAPIPECVRTATAEYRAESDDMSGFLNEKCIERIGSRIRASELYKAFKEWATEQGMREKEILSANAFGRRMANKYHREKARDGTYYQGLILNDGNCSATE